MSKLYVRIPLVMLMSFLLGLFISLHSNVAHANTYNASWATKTIYVYVDANVSSKWQIANDVYQWSAAGGLNMYVTKDKTKAQINVHQQDLPSPNAAQTSMAFSGGHVTYADVTLDSTMITNNSSTCSLRHVATHELGHALGLDHNTSSSTSLMFTGYTKTCYMYPNKYDYSELRKLYPF